ncbi:Protein ENHANCED DISEASE RESISTANCE 2-like [Cardamine amara subsp. amara]|uniref:Protein ENHANCED DISEASE RESISTANCE 2-like n=1 Tax=Cardamine amara subsp. amara TaxID=228776 RepID=A0ABD1B1L1_CARAN
MNQTKTSADDNNSKPAKTESISAVPGWITETINGGSFRHVDLHTGSNGWASPPGNVFSLRSTTYFTNKQKSPGGDYLLSPAGVDWLKSTSKLDHTLSRPDNRVIHALKKSQSVNSFIFAINFQIPSKEHYSLVLYSATEEPIPSDSFLHKLINGDDSLRNQRFKLVSQVVKGPWVVKAASGNLGAFVLGKTVKCNYHRGSNYFEIDVDVSTSAILAAFVRLALGYVTSLTVDVGLVMEALTEDELPERLIGGVRICHMELSSAFLVDDQKNLQQPPRMMGSVEANQEEDNI